VTPPSIAAPTSLLDILSAAGCCVVSTLNTLSVASCWKCRYWTLSSLCGGQSTIEIQKICLNDPVDEVDSGERQKKAPPFPRMNIHCIHPSQASPRSDPEELSDASLIATPPLSHTKHTPMWGHTQPSQDTCYSISAVVSQGHLF
jgi:hypothetical protein